MGGPGISATKAASKSTAEGNQEGAIFTHTIGAKEFLSSHLPNFGTSLVIERLKEENASGASCLFEEFGLNRKNLERIKQDVLVGLADSLREHEGDASYADEAADRFCLVAEETRPMFLEWTRQNLRNGLVYHVRKSIERFGWDIDELKPAGLEAIGAAVSDGDVRRALEVSDLIDLKPEERAQFRLTQLERIYDLLDEGAAQEKVLSACQKLDVEPAEMKKVLIWMLGHPQVIGRKHDLVRASKEYGLKQDELRQLLPSLAKELYWKGFDPDHNILPYIVNKVRKTVDSLPFRPEDVGQEVSNILVCLLNDDAVENAAYVNGAFPETRQDSVKKSVLARVEKYLMDGYIGEAAKTLCYFHLSEKDPDLLELLDRLEKTGLPQARK